MKKTNIILMLALLLVIPLAHAQAASGFTKIKSGLTTTTYTDNTCPNLSSCYYQVTASDSLGAESQPSACSATVLCVGGNQVVAQMPSSGTHTVTLNWTASTTTGVTYNVYQHIGPLPASNVNVTVN